MLLWLLNHIPSFFIHIIIAVGIVLYFFGNMIPIPIGGYMRTDAGIKILGILIFTFGIYLEGLTGGAGVLQSELDEAKAEIVKINEQSKQITEKVVVKYVTEQKQVKDRGDQIAKYINTNNDKVCTVYNSTVELLNSAAQNKLPDPTRAVDDTPAGPRNNTGRSNITK